MVWLCSIVPSFQFESDQHVAAEDARKVTNLGIELQSNSSALSAPDKDHIHKR